MRLLTIIATVVMSAVLSLGLWWFFGARIPMFLLPLLLLLPLVPRPSKIRQENRQQRMGSPGRPTSSRSDAYAESPGGGGRGGS
jgi:hypothetical protein